MLYYIKEKCEGVHHPYLQAGRAELRRTQRTRSSQRHIEGAAGCRLTTQCYGAQVRWWKGLAEYLNQPSQHFKSVILRIFHVPTTPGQCIYVIPLVYLVVFIIHSCRII